MAMVTLKPFLKKRYRDSLSFSNFTSSRTKYLIPIVNFQANFLFQFQTNFKFRETDVNYRIFHPQYFILNIFHLEYSKMGKKVKETS